MDVGLLLLRLVVGTLFAGHGARKLAGWFGGSGLHGTSDRFESLGYRPGIAFATAAGLTQAGAGILFLLGLYVPLASALAIGVLVVAIGTVYAPHGLWEADGGYEYPAVLVAVSATLAFTGPGSAAVGGAATGVGWGFTALLAGIAAGTAVLAFRHRAGAEPALDLTRDEERPAEGRPDPGLSDQGLPDEAPAVPESRWQTEPLDGSDPWERTEERSPRTDR